ncbi:MAG TPA: SMI1/KNR4 family protein [Bacteroidia bacterium]
MAKKLMKQYDELYGKPDWIIDTDPTDPGMLKLLVYDAEPEYELPHTSVCSAGFSTRSKKHSVEFRMEVNGKLSEKYVIQLGSFFEKLYELIIKDKEIMPAKIYGPLTVPGFKGIKSAMIIDSGYMSMEMLDYDANTGRVMTVLPMNKEEAAGLLEMNPEFCERMILTIHDHLRDSKRSALSLARVCMSTLWERIADWYKQNKIYRAAELQKAIKTSASSSIGKNAEKIEKAVGIKLFPDFHISLDIIQSQMPLKSFYAFSPTQVIDTCKSMNKMNDAGTFKDALYKLRGNPAIQQVWWHKHWVPFAMDSYGRYLVVDMAPGPQGEKGQVLLHDNIEGPLHTGYDSFFSWLNGYHSELVQGEYTAGDDGRYLDKE